jgi:hypothetical protein
MGPSSQGGVNLLPVTNLVLGQQDHKVACRFPGSLQEHLPMLVLCHATMVVREIFPARSQTSGFSGQIQFDLDYFQRFGF